MAVRLQALHELGPQPELNVSDRASGDGAWFRLGRRAHVGRVVTTLTRGAAAATCPTASSSSTRVGEGLTERRISDGRIGYGPSEYLDQTGDGRPVRVDE